MAIAIAASRTCEAPPFGVVFQVDVVQVLGVFLAVAWCFPWRFQAICFGGFTFFAQICTDVALFAFLFSFTILIFSNGTVLARSWFGLEFPGITQETGAGATATEFTFATISTLCALLTVWSAGNVAGWTFHTRI